MAHDWRNYETCQCGEPGCYSYRNRRTKSAVPITLDAGQVFNTWLFEVFRRGRDGSANSLVEYLTGAGFALVKASYIQEMEAKLARVIEVRDKARYNAWYGVASSARQFSRAYADLLDAALEGDE